MRRQIHRSLKEMGRMILACLCAVLTFQNGLAQNPPPAQQGQAPQGQASGGGGQQAQTLPPEQIDSLVAPLALYPDGLLSQILVASTYPLEVVECSRWLQKNSKLKEKELTAAVGKQDWDASVQALVLFPDVLKRMDENLDWTTDLGNAFLAQQSDVMDAVQRLRKKAQSAGALKSNEQQKVSTKTENNTTYIVVEPANPQVVYVPQYNPTVVYGAPPPYYPYPPMYYPPSTGAVIASSMISFGVGMAMGAMWSGGWGWGCGWGGGHNNVTINNNFISSHNFNRNSIAKGGNSWQHNPSFRGGVPYKNQNVANRYNNGNRGNVGNNRNGVGDRNGVGNNRNGVGDRNNGVGNNNRNGVGDRNSGVGNNNRNNGAGDRNSGVGNNNRGNSGAGQNRDAAKVGNRDAGGGNFGNRSSGSAFGDAGQSGNRAKQNYSRGSQSAGGGGSRSYSGGGGGGGAASGGARRSGGGGGGGGGGGRRR